jgi:hypothetical protein
MTKVPRYFVLMDPPLTSPHSWKINAAIDSPLLPSLEGRKMLLGTVSQDFKGIIKLVELIPYTIWTISVASLLIINDDV